MDSIVPSPQWRLHVQTLPTLFPLHIPLTLSPNSLSLSLYVNAVTIAFHRPSLVRLKQEPRETSSPLGLKTNNVTPYVNV